MVDLVLGSDLGHCGVTAVAGAGLPHHEHRRDFDRIRRLHEIRVAAQKMVEQLDYLIEQIDWHSDYVAQLEASAAELANQVKALDDDPLAASVTAFIPIHETSRTISELVSELQEKVELGYFADSLYGLANSLGRRVEALQAAIAK